LGTGNAPTFNNSIYRNAGFDNGWLWVGESTAATPSPHERLQQNCLRNRQWWRLKTRLVHYCLCSWIDSTDECKGADKSAERADPFALLSQAVETVQ